jgi:hypothetical protein
LSSGIDWQSENTTVTKAEGCCTNRDVYYFDEEERFFLVSCLALWYISLMSLFGAFLIHYPAGMPGKATAVLPRSYPRLHKV